LDAGGVIIQTAACSLSDLISDTLESFSALANERRVSLTGTAAPNLDPAMLDAPRIGRVLNNLIDNALRHTQAGGSDGLPAMPAIKLNVMIPVKDKPRGFTSRPSAFIAAKTRNRDTAPWLGSPRSIVSAR
jgi:K+-sensing histidine kinase KdpD